MNTIRDHLTEVEQALRDSPSNGDKPIYEAIDALCEGFDGSPSAALAIVVCQVIEERIPTSSKDMLLSLYNELCDRAERLKSDIYAHRLKEINIDVMAERLRYDV